MALNHPSRTLLAGLILAALPSMNALADEKDTRHGGAKNSGFNFEGGLTMTAQDADDSRIQNEYFASLDLVGTFKLGPGELLAYLEGNSTQRPNGVSNTLGESNGDAGSALNRGSHGRAQISELHYTLPVGGGDFTIGLIDTKGFVDSSHVANDEGAQFLSGNLVNNASIVFPDYTLGMAYHRDYRDGAAGYTVVLTSSHGIADNTNRTYSELFDVGRSGKGVFAVVEPFWTISDYTVRAGIWANTSDQTHVDGSAGTDSSYGVYAVVDGSFSKNTLWNVRAGIADEETVQGSEFLSAAVEHHLGKMTYGAGIAHTFLSGDNTTATNDDTTVAELYARYDLNDNVQITPSVQMISNSGFDGSGASFDDNVTVFNMRINLAF